MEVLITVGIALGAVVGLSAIGAWGCVQVLDIMEALDLRRQAKAAELKRAKEYLKDPQRYEERIGG